MADTKSNPPPQSTQVKPGIFRSTSSTSIFVVKASSPKK
jgi:hypothetical protein